MNATMIEPRMKGLYREAVRDQLQTQLDLPNVMQVPTLSKISVNSGVGDALVNRAFLDAAMEDLTKITGQKPSVTRAKKSIAGFKLREGNAIGAKVTLRNNRMWEFYDRLVSLAIPRIRDFRGVARRGLDGRGNYTIGIREQIIFPEIDYNEIDKIRGLQVTIATTAKNDAEAIRLLELYGMPFIKDTVEA